MLVNLAMPNTKVVLPEEFSPKQQKLKTRTCPPQGDAIIM
jgi:hypothetical protein